MPRRPLLAFLAVTLAAALGQLALAGPSAAAASWRWRAPLIVNEANPLNAIDCPTVRLCIAVDNDGNIVRSTDPTGGAKAWSLVHVVHDPVDLDLVGIACPTARLCVIADGLQSVFTSTDPAVARRWTPHHIEPVSGLTSISCPTVRLCVASDGDESVLTTTDPTSASAAWTRTPIATEGNQGCLQEGMDDCAAGIENVDCPSARLCVAVDGQGFVLTSTDPTGGAGAWSVGLADLNGEWPTTKVSCPSAAFCAFGGGYGQTFATTLRPGAGAAAWHLGRVAFVDWSLSCPLRHLCLASDPDVHRTWFSVHPAAGSGRWQASHIDPGSEIIAASCPSPTLCLAIDNGGQVVVGTNARGRPSHRGPRGR